MEVFDRMKKMEKRKRNLSQRSYRYGRRGLSGGTAMLRKRALLGGRKGGEGFKEEKGIMKEKMGLRLKKKL